MDEHQDRPEPNSPTSGAHRARLTQDYQVHDVVRDVMSPCPRMLSLDAKVQEAAELMRREDIGDVLVMADDHRRLVGILTDRDIVVRALAEGRGPAQTRIGDVCSQDVVTIHPDESVGTALRIMREHAIRRVPVADDREVLGMLTIGDIAVERDSRTALADISAAQPNT